MSQAPILPDPRVPDPGTAPTLGWGVIGPGRIATDFVTSLQAHTRQQVTAVGSRSPQRGERFARHFGIDGVHDSYEALVADPAVDIVYIAVPHTSHAEAALLAIEAGKHVLVEKPFALTAAEATRVAAAARAAGVFAAEAMWPRYLPAYDMLRQLLAEGTLGTVNALVADLGEWFEPDPTARLFDPRLGGGARLDLGAYLAALSSFVGGPAREVTARGTRTTTGVDASFAATLVSETDVVSSLYCTLTGPTPTRAFIGGTEASITIDAPFYAPPRLRVEDVRRRWSTTAEFTQTGPHTGLAFEAAHIAQCIAEGRTETPLLPLDETIAIAHTLDRIAESMSSQRVAETHHAGA